ncbi:hypothetical protein [Stutzerimonas nitrititolerans]|uniref:hypothetical protein n=1 Tax=Stutzerimonas nitrititolerans TaxID=2482751 RepID=UPI003AA87DC1
MNFKKGLMWLQASATVAGVVGLFALVWIIMLAVQNGAVGAAWVQAIGSVVAIIVAIAVAYHSQQQAQDMRAAADAERDLAHAARLRMLIWEAAQATAQFRSRTQQNQLREELLDVMEDSDPVGWQRPAQHPLVLARDVSFYQRIMQRAMNNLDDDLNAKRHIIAAKFRFNLSVLMTFLEKSVDHVAAGELIDKLESAHNGFEEDISKLDEYCPRLAELGVTG